MTGHVLRLRHPSEHRLVFRTFEHLSRGSLASSLVLTKPGATALTLMLEDPRSTAADLVSPINAALLAVVRDAEAGPEGLVARDVHDLAVPLRPHVRAHGLDAVERTGHVGAEQLPATPPG